MHMGDNKRLENFRRETWREKTSRKI